MVSEWEAFDCTKMGAEITIVKKAPCKIPLWISLFNVPLEAWSVKGISTIASRLGRPIKMDKLTADMCKEGSGRLGYARVLVEVDAGKEYVDKVEIDYVDNQMNIKRTKWVRAEANKQNIGGNNNEGFVEVKNRRNRWGNNGNFNKRVQRNNIPARRDNVTTNVKYAFKPKEPVPKPVVTPTKENPKSGGTASNGKIGSDKAWRISNENAKELRKSANKYAVLSNDENGSNEEEEFVDKRLIVDEFIRKKKAKNGEADSDDEDVYENKNEAIQNIIANEVLDTNIGGDAMSGEQLHTSKRIFNSHPWIVMGDYNVTAKPEEQSNGASVLTSDMRDLKDAINALEIEDIYSSAHGVFLPYVVSDHNPGVLIVPEGLPKKKKTFRFVNYIADKSDFIDVMKQGWDLNVKGCKMFKVVKKLKNLKKPLNELDWKNGNLYDNVVKIKHQLKEAQSKVEADPFNLDNKLEAVELLNKYNKSAEDELKLLHQITKVKWLKEGDRNSAYFHNILKARRHKNRVETIFEEDGVRYNRSNVADQFVNHFKNFLGKSIPVKPLSSLGGIVLLKLCEEDATGMIEVVSDNEIKDALFDIDY
ncbi:RNA-directed DNA polymerase, eukaryota, reverse transcriptase zinc-binding domain protein [Tanacetum coccineum]